MGEPKEQNPLLSKIITIAITAIITAAIMGVVTLGADRQRLADVEHGLVEHVKIADEKINELNALKTNQAVMSSRLESIDKTLKEINDEIKKRR